MQSLVIEWRQRVVRSADLFEQRNQALLTDGFALETPLIGPDHLPLGPSMSLLLTADSEIRPVHWSSYRRNEGQVVRIDRFHRAIFPMAMADREPVHPMTGMFVVHPRIGVEIVKDRARGRPTLPAGVLSLQQAWRLGLGKCNPPMTDRCDFCMSGEQLITCPICMLTSHDRCSKAAAASVQIFVHDWPERPHIDFEPLQLWMDPAQGRICCCELCFAVFRV